MVRLKVGNFNISILRHLRLSNNLYCQARHLYLIKHKTISATDQKQKLGGHTQLFGEQLITLKDLNEFKNDLLLEQKKPQGKRREQLKNTYLMYKV